MKLETDPAYDRDDLTVCLLCRDDGRPVCSACGGCEPQLTLAQAVIAQQERVSMQVAAFFEFVDRLPASEDEDAA